MIVVRYLCLCMGFFLSCSLWGQEMKTGATAEELGRFRSEMQHQVLLSQRKVDELGRATTGMEKAPSLENRKQLDAAIETFNRKSLLVGTYYYSPALQNEAFRKALMEVLKKDTVTDSDVANLATQSKALNS